MKVLERNKAIELRKTGKTFNEILNEVPVSKGSLSLWLEDIALTNDQVARIKYKNDRIKSKFIEFNELRKEKSRERKLGIIKSASDEIENISTRELKLIGIALYWAEGYKAHACSGAEFTNTDPGMITLMMRWFREICGVQETRFRIRIQIHNPTNIEEIIRHWSNITGLSPSQFTKTYFKTSSSSKRKTGNVVPYGICSIRVSDISLITRIRGWIQGLTALSSSPV